MQLLSPRDLADALGVSESSLKRWIDAGKITASRTEGGHRRILLGEAMRFIRETGAPLARPELLGMPEVAAARTRATGERLISSLVAGDVVAARGWLIERYLAGASIAELGDGPIREAMHELGELWRHDDGGIFVEHRATDCCLQALAQLRSLSALAVPADAPLAIGCAPEDDPYLLPSFMAAAVVAAAGLRVMNLGPDTPLSALRFAVDQHAPELVWVSVTAPLAPARARAIARWLSELPRSVVAVLGGQQSRSVPVGKSVVRVETMAELATLAGATIKR